MSKGDLIKPAGTRMLTLIFVILFVFIAVLSLLYTMGYFKSNQVTGCSSMISCIVAMIKYYIGMKG